MSGCFIQAYVFSFWSLVNYHVMFLLCLLGAFSGGRRSLSSSLMSEPSEETTWLNLLSLSRCLCGDCVGRVQGLKCILV